MLVLLFNDLFNKNILHKSALEIGLTHQLAIYDSLYIALALQLSYPLISVDNRQVNAAINYSVAIIPITNFTE